ncbi:sensor histidine kinase, partial [Streptomyces sp. MZ04]
MWTALRRRGYLASSAPWRALGYLGGGIVLGVVVLIGGLAAALVGVALSLVLIGLPLLALLAFTGIPVAALERRRLRHVDPGPA